MDTLRVIVPLTETLHDLEPDRHVFPLVDRFHRITVGIGFDEHAAIVATIPAGEDTDPEQLGLKIRDAATEAGLHPTGVDVMTKTEYDARTLADVPEGAMEVDDDV